MQKLLSLFIFAMLLVSLLFVPAPSQAFNCDEDIAFTCVNAQPMAGIRPAQMTVRVIAAAKG
ncbi:MAG: hypothetical protein AB7G80_03830 [Dongiaceae bacterium]